ncbi:MAG: hypothetical protein Q9214_001022, partial [Letrouitia sp. 1 TL-2023]
EIQFAMQQNGEIPADKLFSHPSPEIINQAIKLGFLHLDNDIIQMAAEAILGPTALNEAVSDIEPANTGSCALLAIYDVATQLLRVANAGDSRAVLGKRNAAGEWEAIPLSVDQTASDENEAARIKAEHPNEPNVIDNGQVLGRAISRAFGDIRCTMLGPVVRTEPVITTTKIEPEKGDFVIMASGGLWDNLTSEQAVELVGRWLKQNDVHHIPSKFDMVPLLNDSSLIEKFTKGPPADNPEPYMAYTDLCMADEKHFVVVDDNAAAHLVRNSLGGDREDLLRGMFSGNPPYSGYLK